MTNPDDRWRLTSPTPPHAPPHDPQIPGMPPPSGGGSSGADFAAPVTGGGGGGGCAFLLVVLIFSAPIFLCLYPLAAGTALAVSLTSNKFLRGAGFAPDNALPVSILVFLVVFWPMSRLDHRLAENVPPYRLVRHVARVVLTGFFLTLYTAGGVAGDLIMPRSIAQLQLMLASSTHLITMAIAMVFAHLLLTRAKGLQAYWDNGLEIFKLRQG